jgi:L-ascorbate metabolism protein UlaG (beta-lactamase superfamily)
MFDLEYKGGNTVVFSTKKLSLIVDPKLSLVGLRDMKLKDGVELATENRFSVRDSEAQLIVDQPGEYEVGDFTIRGIAATRHIDTPEQEKLSTMYRIECGDVNVAVLGNIDPKLNDDQLEGIGVVDILIIPVGGGGYTLDATSAATLTRSIEPKAVVPVHYADSGLTYEVPQDQLSTFISELGAPAETMAKYKVKSSTSLPATLTVIELTRS